MKFTIAIAALLLTSFMACSKGKPNVATDIGDSIGDEGIADLGGGGGGLDLGNTPGTGDLTDADKTALNNAANESNNVAPEEGNGLPDDLLAEAQNLLNKEKNGEDVTMLKMALANKILQQCAGGVAALAPIPGQPLLGSWGSVDSGACKVEFDVVGPISGGAGGVSGSSTSGGSGQGATAPASSSSSSGSGGASASSGGSAVYGITGLGTPAAKEPKKEKDAKKKDKKNGKMGPLDGQMTAGADGSGQVQAKPYTGRLMDQPASGTGSLTNPEATKTKYGAEACVTKVSLKTSTNPIPENYIQAMKKNGQCHRKALMLMSPIFDNLFKTLDPNLATTLQGSALGM